jgi:hypothetical protein
MSASASYNSAQIAEALPRRGGSGMTTYSRKAAPKRHSSTFLNTLNRIKPVICVQDLCRATAEVEGSNDI